MTTVKQYDALNRLTSITSATGSVAVAAAAYTNNLANQRTAMALADGTSWAYQYDALGQVQSGKKHWADGTVVPGEQFEYSHDNIGNRTSTSVGGDQSGAGLRPATYAPNALNQYTNRAVSSQVDVTGIANASTNVALTVTINGQGTTPYRHNEYFQALGSVGNSSGPVWAGVTVTRILTCPSFVRKTLSGFRSRWMIPFSCAVASPEAT